MRTVLVILLATCSAAIKVGAGAAHEAASPPQHPSDEPAPERTAPHQQSATDDLAAAANAAAPPGGVLRGLDEDHGTSPAPLGLDFLRVTSGECQRCLKTCLGGKIQGAQMTFMKIQAPLSLLTWYLFKNRPFTMVPLEKALAKLFGVPPALVGGAAVGAYLSCRPLCDLDCPYPGGSPAAEELPELDNADPSDLLFLHRLYQRPGGGGGRKGGGGSFSQAVSDMFRLA